jgi:hypothetical protein
LLGDDPLEGGVDAGPPAAEAKFPSHLGLEFLVGAEEGVSDIRILEQR